MVLVQSYDDAKRNINNKFWLNILNLPETCIKNTKTIVSFPKKKKNRYEYGGCKLYVCNTELVQKIFGAIKAYAGIDDKDLWL